MHILIVDDNPARHQTYLKALKPTEPGDSRLITCVYTFDDAIVALQNIPFDRIYLDFDLNDHGELSMEVGTYGGRKLTGLDVAAAIVRLQPAAEVVVHSHNPWGAVEIFDYLSHMQVPVGFELFWEGVGPLPDYEDPETVKSSVQELSYTPFDIEVIPDPGSTEGAA